MPGAFWRGEVLQYFVTLSNLVMYYLTISVGRVSPVTYADVTQQVDLPLISDTECDELLHRTLTVPQFKFNKENMMCAGPKEGGKGICVVRY